MSEKAKREEALEYVQKLRGFYKHLSSFIIVNVILAAFNFIHEPHNLWFYWVTIFWGIGLVSHAFSTFGPGRRMGKAWEDKKVKEYMDRDKK